MSDTNHYRTLNITPEATPEEIKRAYRHLAKQFHPDSQQETANTEKIIQVNAAYEVLSDPQRRRCYDQQLHSPQTQRRRQNRQQRTAQAQQQYRHQRQTSQRADTQFSEWLRLVYQPVNRLISRILNPLDDQLDELSADPFDDQLMAVFHDYLEECQDYLVEAQSIFRSRPNPATVAGAAATLYYCLNQLGDGLEELKIFTLNYDYHYLHTGQELFRIANGLRHEAQVAMRAMM